MSTAPTLSAFERLPIEIRQEVYFYCGFPVGRRVISGGEPCQPRLWNSAGGSASWPDMVEGANSFLRDCEKAPLKVNRAVRKEVLDLLFRKLGLVFGKLDVCITDSLQMRYGDNWQLFYTYRHAPILPVTFSYLTSIVLSGIYEKNFPWVDNIRHPQGRM